MTTTTQPRKTLPGVVTRPRWMPPKICLYGDAGVGKSTFGTGAPNPIFIPTEAGVENLDVARFPVAETLDAFQSSLELVANGDHDHGAVVIDTLNGLASMYHQAKRGIIGDKGKPLYDFVGYGGHSGWSSVAQDIRENVFPLINRCQRRGMYVIVIAHAGTYTDKTSTHDVVKSGASINKIMWRTVLAEMDVVGKAEYVYTVRATVGDKAAKIKAETDVEVVDGVRVKQRHIVFEGGVEVDAKTRIGYELPPTMPLSWEVFASRLGNIKALAGEVRELWEFMPEDKRASTMGWMGVDTLERLAETERSKLSQLRNRLLELKSESESISHTGETNNG